MVDRAVRGATQVDCNSREDILNASAELVAEVIRCRGVRLVCSCAMTRHSDRSGIRPVRHTAIQCQIRPRKTSHS